ncbi:patatin-like phospholipase family protein [Neolewinella persica]|uniref:patatin-like phospholipase family protein n=1 Tax=Neolewinella persica TaxID=70998 RepID=UPI00036218C3|nr:patatin-like phospholipase family protein [Neolewinella persica]
MQKPIRVLTIDGGGTRGLFPATILRKLEEETGQSVTDMFDVIAGNATGGIIAMGLAAGMKIENIAEIYRDQAGFILPSSFWRRVWNPVNLFAPRYPNKNFKQLLTERLGADSTLADVTNRFGTKTIFLTGTLDMSPALKDGEAPGFKIVVYNSAFKTYDDESLVDISMRTSAAAVNLPLYQHYSESGNYANDPAMMALSFCMNQQRAASPGESILPDNALGLKARPEDIKFLSLGCGSDGSSYVPREKIGKGTWGLMKWAGRLISLVIHTNMAANQYYVQQFLNPSQYFRLSAYYKADDAPGVLKDKKLKIDVTDKEQLLAIQSYAEKTYAKQREALLAFLDL